jgi:hypothetical protein
VDRGFDRLGVELPRWIGGVANTMTINPIAAALLATQLVGEPITPNLVVGLVAVFAGIWIATTNLKPPRVAVLSGADER